MTLLSAEKHVKPLRFFLSVNRHDLSWLWVNIVLYTLGQTSMFAAVYVLGNVVNDITSGGPTERDVILMLALIVVYEIFYRVGHFCEVKIVSKVRRNVKWALFDHTHSLSFGYFSDRFAGEIAHKVVSTADSFERLVIITANRFFEYGILLPLSAVTFWMIDPYYGIFASIWFVVLVAGSWALGRALDERSATYAAEEAKTTGAIVDEYGNISSVKVYGGRKDHERHGRQIDRETEAFVRLGRWEILMYHFQGLMIIILAAGLIAISASLHSSGIISIGSLVFLAAAGFRLAEAAWEAGPSVAEFIRHRGECIQNLSDLVVAPAVLDGDHAHDSMKKDAEVEYRSVSFGYNHEQNVLDGFSISIKPRQKVGIVGLSGAGKTTFANLLLRFFDPQKGSITLNGTDIKDLTQEYLRSHISYISQDTSLFHATVAENIAYGSEAASENDIERVAKLAYADEFIDTLPKGYESIVGDRGIKLSGGQRQRIAIARAILADRPLFLLDEATSALDSDSEAKIQKALANLMEHKTVIAIAHRLSTLSHMDRIVYLEDGKIAEDGTHDELIAKNGKYAALWKMQAGGFLPDKID